jgi:ribonuclease T2
VQFDQKTMVRVGAAIVVFVVAALFKVLSGGGDLPISSSPATRTADELPAPPPLGPDSPQPTAEARDALTAGSASAAPPISHGDFDYYVLVLSWSPTHCSSDAGQGRGNDMQCRSGRPFGFVLHGLWPQNEHDYPQACETSERDVSSENMSRALKVAPSETLVRHEWEKHGTCSGLSQDDFFSTAISAYSSVALPASYKLPAQPIETTPDDVRDAFLATNPQLAEEDVSATCSRNDLAEVWVCLDKSLHPRACSNEVRKRHCGGRHVRMLATRGDWP